MVGLGRASREFTFTGYDIMEDNGQCKGKGIIGWDRETGGRSGDAGLLAVCT